MEGGARQQLLEGGLPVHRPQQPRELGERRLPLLALRSVVDLGKSLFEVLRLDRRIDWYRQALDRGAPFDSTVICQRCRSVFASLDLSQEVCRDLAGDTLPPGLRERLAAAIAAGSTSEKS